MTIYNVRMEQAISVANLGANTLMTGYGDVGESIQSCAAVILINPGTGAAGLYHYPAGDISQNMNGQALLRSMRTDIAPTECRVVAGTTTNSMGTADVTSGTPSDPFHAALVAHLRTLTGLVPIVTTTGAARTASVSLAAGATVIDTGYQGGAITDLAIVRIPGQYPNYKIYWENQFQPAPPPQGCCIIL